MATVKRLTAVVVAVVAAWSGVVPVAAAEPYARAYGDNGASWAEATTYHGAVCDNDRDGHGVLGKFRTSGNTTVQKGDANGSEAGCGQIDPPRGASFTQVQICVDGEDCSDWEKIQEFRTAPAPRTA